MFHPTPAAYQVAPIDTASLLSAQQLINGRVQYRHFSHGDETFTGIITDVRESKFGTEVLIQPDKVDTMSLLPKWRSLRNDVIGWAWIASGQTMEVRESEKATA